MQLLSNDQLNRNRIDKGNYSQFCTVVKKRKFDAAVSLPKMLKHSMTATEAFGNHKTFARNFNI